MIRKIDPNHLTTLRLFLTPLAMYLLMHNAAWSFATCLGVMTVAELTDFFDGYLARKFDKISDFGKLYDPMCDSIYHLLIFISLVPYGLTVWAVGAFAARDIIIAYSRIFMSLKGVALAARWSGKYKAVSQLVSQFLFVSYLLAVSMIGAAHPLAVFIWHYLACPAISAALLITLYSLIDYLLYAKAESIR